jgi:predicted TIM-barrel fold metal-dependent hydrolase
MHDVPDHAPLCAAPDRLTRPPHLPFPARACDCHAHIFGPAAQYPYAAERIYTPPDSTWTDYLALLETLGVERAVLVQPSVYGTDNSAMLAALAAIGPGVRAVAVADPDVPARDLETWHRAGVRGLRFNVVDRRDAPNVIPADALRAVAARIASFGWHLELLVNLDEAADFAGVLAALPVPVVLGHLGYPRGGARAWAQAPAFADLLRLLATGQCWIKLTGPYRISAIELPYEDVDVAARKLVETAPQRMLWGSDWPHAMMKKRMPNDGDLADLLERWAPDAPTRARILVDNPAELYGFATEEKIGG